MLKVCISVLYLSYNITLKLYLHVYDIYYVKKNT